MTLIELMIATTLTGIILAAGFGLTNQLIRTVSVDRHSGNAAAAAELRRNLSLWLRNVQLGVDGIHYPFTGEGPPRPALRVLLSAVPGHRSTPAVATVFVSGPEDSMTGLVMQLNSLTGDREDVVALEESIGAMELKYLVDSPRGTMWVDGYASSSELPRAVEIRFRPRPGKRLHPILELPLLIPLERP